MNLYAGKILKVDLASEKAWIEELNLDWARKYIGGKGLGFRYLFNLMDPRSAPLSSDNVLIFMTGPVGGTVLPNSSRLSVITKSPATRTILDSSMGGSLGSEIKYSGYDGIVILGKAADPVYLVVNDESVQILNSGHLQGKGVFETETKIREDLREDYKIAAIGPAGENLVPFACITSDSYRHAGRGGAGAVMGSKNLKALAVKGSKAVRVANMDSFLTLAMKMFREAVSEGGDPSRNNVWVIKEGTPFLIDSVNEMGILPARNFQEGRSPSVEKINSQAVSNMKKKDRACVSCPLACGKFTAANGSMVEGPEYETLTVAGSNCGIEDLDAIIRFNESCDDLGLDAISTGNVIAFAMEMTEKGKHDFGVTFGDVENYLEIPGEVARKEGRGIDLSLGVRRLALKYKAKEFAMEVKGLEFPGYEPRGNYGMGLAYATSDRGACHLRAYTVYHSNPFDLEAMTREVISHQNRLSVKNCLIFCLLLHSVNVDEMAEILNVGLGASVYRGEDLWKTGERIWNLGRLFNLRAGITRKEDNLPERVFKEGLQNSPQQGRILSKKDFTTMLRNYYKYRGWDVYGHPKREKLAELEVDIEV